MPKAELTLPNGTKVTIDGTTEEVSVLLAIYGGGHTPLHQAPAKKPSKPRPRAGASSSREKKPKKNGVQDHIQELRGEGFFKSKRTIGDVRQELETNGHIYPVTSLSGPLLGLVRSRDLGRVKEDKVWKYVHR